MSSVSFVPSSSFISGGSGGDEAESAGSGSKIQQIQQKIQKVLQEIKELVDSEELPLEVKKKLITAKQMEVQVYQGQIIMIQSQEAQEATMEQMEKMVDGLESLTANPEKSGPKATESVINHIGEDTPKVLDSIKEAEEDSGQNQAKEENDPFLRGPRRPINEYV